MSNHSPVGSQHHIVPVSTYIFTWMVLIFLVVATIGASLVQLPGAGNNIVAMAIAMIKAILVIAIFMGVKYGTKLTKVWAMIGFVWVMFIFGILLDYAVRVPINGFNNDIGSGIPVQAQSIGPQPSEQDSSQGYKAPSQNKEIPKGLTP